MRTGHGLLRMWKTLLALCLIAGPAAAQIPGLTLTPVPIPSPRTVNPYRIGPGSAGRIWFTDVTFRQVGFIASGGAITAFRLVDSADPNNEVRPLAITEGPDGNGWFTVSVTNSSGSPLRTEIGRVTPTGVITRFPTPTVDGCRVFGANPVCDITVGPDGNLWFTETQAKNIGKITPSGQITEYLADGPGGEFFYGITAGPDGNLWVADSGSDIIRITPAGVITFFNRQGLVPIEITSGPDGNVWFTDRASDSIGRITPTGVITLFPTPSPTSDPEGIARGSDGKLYFTEVSARKIGQIDPATGVINESAVPNGEAPLAIVSRVGSNKIGAAGIIGDIGDMVINAANAVGDYSIYVAKLTGQPTPPVGMREMEISKEFLKKSDFVRRGGYVVFEIKVKNSGKDEVTAPWDVNEFPGVGLFNCQDFASVDFDPGPSSSAGSTFAFKPRSYTLGSGQEKTFTVICNVDREGPINNRVVLDGGGAPRKEVTFTFNAIEDREEILELLSDDLYVGEFARRDKK